MYRQEKSNRENEVRDYTSGYPAKSTGKTGFVIGFN